MRQRKNTADGDFAFTDIEGLRGVKALFLEDGRNGYTDGFSAVLELAQSGFPLCDGRSGTLVDIRISPDGIRVRREGASLQYYLVQKGGVLEWEVGEASGGLMTEAQRGREFVMRFPQVTVRKVNSRRNAKKRARK